MNSLPTPAPPYHGRHASMHLDRDGAARLDIETRKVVRTMANRVLYKDIVPYDTPSSLDALRGPATGTLEVPITVHWGPRRRFDLDDPRDVHAVYRALVREGTTAVQEELLNQDVLRRLWAELMLPERCRRVWEERFPELAG